MIAGVSVLICCFNSSLRLPETLRHLALQNTPDDLQWEIIVIDNASTDGTATIAQTEWNRYQGVLPSLSIVMEPRPGKNFAFKTGVEAAAFTYVLTCDDDNWLTPDYVFSAFSIMQRDDMIAALGGNGIFEPERPLNDQITGFSNYYVNGPQRWASTNHWVYGAGSVYKKRVLTDLYSSGWEQVTTGRTGTSLICGEDVEICQMMYLMGYKIIAEDSLKFRHFVPLGRQQAAYLVKLSFWLGYSEVLLSSYFKIVSQAREPFSNYMNRWFVSTTRSILKMLAIACYHKLSGKNGQTMEKQLHFQAVYGRWSALLRNRTMVIRHHEQVKALLIRNKKTPHD